MFKNNQLLISFMRKKRLIVLIFALLLINTQLILAELTPEQEQTQVEEAYNCLENQIDTTDCSRVTVPEAIFSLLSINKCLNRVESEAQGDMECWPKNNCDIKTTAQAILALDAQGISSENAEEWLLNQNKTPTNLDWYIEIDSNEATTCDISYSGTSYTVNIGADKKITGNPGTCLTIGLGGYFLKIKNTCYDNEYEISCDKDFLTTLVYQASGNSTIYVLGEGSVHLEGPGGTTIEKINSYCFAKSDSCDYEGSLWALLALNSKGYEAYEISPYIPYLITGVSSNENLLPESFLYILTGGTDYKTALLQKQISDKFWSASGDKFYDTALALLPFQYQSLTEKNNAKEWLILEQQQEDGCWDNKDILNNAFILYSIWPEFGPSTPQETNLTCSQAGYTCVDNSSVCSGITDDSYECSNSQICCLPSNPGTSLDCEDEGYFCSSMMECSSAGGNTLDDYNCPGFDYCCSVQPETQTCSDLGGIICNSNEDCIGGTIAYPDEIAFNEICCVDGGTCEIDIVSESDCEDNGGICESYGCGNGYVESFDYSCSLGDSCCIAEDNPFIPTDNPTSKWWIWALFGLIVLVTIGILFRDKLKMMFSKSDKGKGENYESRGPPGFPPRPMNPPLRRPMPPVERKILPPSSQNRPAQMPRKLPPKKSPGELDEVLKKLKEMSKE